MNPSRLFILRPVATALLMLAILLAGWVAYRQLPLSALPQVDYPTIQVVTLYPGASPDVVTSGITAPLERQFGQMPGLKQMSSTSSSGASVVTLQFNLEIELDSAEQEVQAAINASSNFLPSDLPSPPIYSKVNPADAPILTLAVTSKTMKMTQVQNLVDTRVATKISQVPGVGLVTLSGGQRPAVRVQVNPRAAAAAGLSMEELRTAINAANVNQAKGSFDGPARAYTIDANDQLRSPEEYRRIVVAFKNGAPVFLADIADVVEDAENARLAAWMNDVPAIILNVQRQPGANTVEIAESIREILPEIRSQLPGGADLVRLKKIPVDLGDKPNPLTLTAAAGPCSLNGNLVVTGDEFESYRRSLKRDVRRVLDRGWRNFTQHPSATFRIVTDADEALRVLAVLEEQQGSRMRELSQNFVLGEASNGRFYRNLVRDNVASGYAVLTMLSAGDEVVAVLLGVREGGRYVMLRVGNAGEKWSHCSPGRLVIDRTMAALHRDGVREFDFSIGNYAYKRRFGVRPFALVDLSAALSWRGLPYALRDRAVRELRRYPRLSARLKRVRGRSPAGEAE